MIISNFRDYILPTLLIINTLTDYYLSHLPWEQRKLSDITDVRDGTHDSPQYVAKGHPLVTSKNLSDEGLDLSEVSLISDYDFDQINKRSNVDVGDILLAMIGTIGHPVLVGSADFAIKNVALIKSGSLYSNKFLLQMLRAPFFEEYVNKKNAGNTQKFLGLGLIRDFTFMGPSTKESEMISGLLGKIDHTIALHQRYCIQPCTLDKTPTNATCVSGRISFDDGLSSNILLEVP